MAGRRRFVALDGAFARRGQVRIAELLAARLGRLEGVTRALCDQLSRSC